MLTPGTIIHERYRIEQLIGQSAMGAVGALITWSWSPSPAGYRACRWCCSRPGCGHIQVSCAGISAYPKNG